MAIFRFSMENILNMKEKLEEQAKHEYARENARLLREQEILEALIQRRQQAEHELRMVLQEVLSVTEIRKKENAVEVIKSYVQQQRLVVKRQEKIVEVAREALTEAMKERKIYEKLKEKAFEEFIREEGRKEQKEVDERMSYQYGTKKEMQNN